MNIVKVTDIGRAAKIKRASIFTPFNKVCFARTSAGLERMLSSDGCKLNPINLINVSLYSLYYPEACKEFVRPISASLHLLAKQFFLKKYRSGGNTVSNLTGPRFESQTSRSRDERVTARTTCNKYQNYY